MHKSLVCDHSNKSFRAVLLGGTVCLFCFAKLNSRFQDHVVLFIMLYKVVLTFQSVDETLVCDHSNESY